MLKQTSSRFCFTLAIWIAFFYFFTTTEALSRPAFSPDDSTSLPLEQRLELVEKKIELALEAKNAQLEAIEKSMNVTYILLGIVGAFFALVTYLGSRSQQRIYSKERSIFNRLTEAQEIRQQETHTLIKNIYKNQFEVSQKEDTYRTESLKKVNEIMTTVQQTLHFRLEQEQLVVRTLKKIDELEKEIITMKQDPDIEYRQLLDQAKRFAQWKRVDFASPSKELKEECKSFQERFDRLPLRYLQEHQNDPEFGILFYYRGLIAYIDNHIIEAKKNFEYALSCKFDNHETIIQMNEEYRRRFSLCEFYLGLIHKNYGSLEQSRIHLRNSIDLHNPPNEVLAPITLAETLSYEAENAKNARELLQKVLHRLEQRANQGQLTQYQKRLIDRIPLFLGNTYFLEKNWRQAFENYEKALEFNRSSYYAKLSIAQTKEKLGNDSQKEYAEALKMIEDSGDLSRKTETTPKIILNLSSLLCALKLKSLDIEKCDNYKKILKSTLSLIKKFNGFELKILCPITKSRLTKEELFSQIDNLYNKTMESQKVS